METPAPAENRWNRRGPQLDEDWQERYLAAMRETGAKWKAARIAGVHRDTVCEYERRDRDFAAEGEHARQEYADMCEIELHEIGRKTNNPLPYFGLLKRHRPDVWNDRFISVSLSATAEVSPSELGDILRLALGSATDTTLRQIVSGTVDGESRTLSLAPANAREGQADGIPQALPPA